MKPHEIENWALRIIERVERRQPNEDSRVELKAKWIEPTDAARRIAGHANAAGSEPILWLIGVDEKQGVQGAAIQELANWWKQVQVQFDGVAPAMKDINVSWKGHTVVVLLFDTERAPFVVRNSAHGKPGGGPVQREVPWREGTATRSATRNDLISLLSPLQRIPRYDLLEGQFIVFPDIHRQSGEKFYIWRLNLTLYMVPKSDAQIVIPSHLCKGSFEIDGPVDKCIKETDFRKVFFPVYGNPWGQGMDGSGGVIDGPGHLYLQAEVTSRPVEISQPGDARIKVCLRPVDADQPVVIDKNLRLVSPGGGELFRWACEDCPEDKEDWLTA
jgi:hypothetical protein